MALDDNYDPTTDPHNPLKYVTNQTYAGIALAAFFICALTHTYFMIRKGGRFMMAMVIAEYTYAIGLAGRFVLHNNPTSLGAYIFQNTFITLSPCGFIAAEYVLLGRLVRWLNAGDHLLIRPTRVTLIFVLSDVTTFLVQAGGGGISASAGGDQDKVDLGSKVFFVGLILQLVSFIVFMLLAARWIFRVWKYEPATWTCDSHLPWFKDWRSLAGAMWISFVCILVRCIFRTIELSEGYQGHLTTTESYFYLFDVIPILNALIQFIPFWPGRFIPKDPTEHHRYLPTSVTSSSAEQVTLNDMERARSKPAGKPYY